jgi:hypothetical protein
VDVARCALAKYVEKLVLTPKEGPDGPLLVVSGDVQLFEGSSEGAAVCSSNGGQGRNRSLLCNIVKIPVGILLDPRMTLSAG